MASRKDLIFLSSPLFLRSMAMGKFRPPLMGAFSFNILVDFCRIPIMIVKTVVRHFSSARPMQ